ncbi:MAG TPA: hypothetical protein VMW15_05725 [Terracidiphilus sp.]|jgi:hypothetical protein|nr:hypothetical protein [Terracidiphilus sp.]
MKRLPGIILAAILLLLGSLFYVLMGVCMAVAAVIERNLLRSRALPAPPPVHPMPPAWMPILLYAFCVFFLALAVWGILTAIGLFRLRPWARYSTLVIGACLALIGVPSMLMTLALLAVPLPMPSTVDPAHAQSVHAVTRVMFAVIVVFYGLISTIGISWLVYFNRKKVREAFSTGLNHTAPCRRPVLISVVAVLSLIGGPACLALVFIPFPGVFLGFILHGWQKIALYIVYAALLTAAGIGLWQLREWARRLALAMQFIGLAQNVVLLARPSLMTRYTEQINRQMNLPQPQGVAQFQTAIYAISFGLGTLFLLAVVAILHHYRAAFNIPSGSPQIESSMHE